MKEKKDKRKDRTKKGPRYDKQILIEVYSYLKASTGAIFAALLAG